MMDYMCPAVDMIKCSHWALLHNHTGDNTNNNDDNLYLKHSYRVSKAKHD